MSDDAEQIIADFMGDETLDALAFSTDESHDHIEAVIRDHIKGLTKQLENATKTCDHQQGSILNLQQQVESLKYHIGNIGANTTPPEEPTNKD